MGSDRSRLWPTVLWRSWFATIVGGALVLAVSVPCIVASARVLGSDFEADPVSVMMVRGVLLGGGIGAVIGLPIGGYLASYVQRKLLPYRGREVTVRSFRTAAMWAVAVPHVVLILLAVLDAGVVWSAVLMLVAGLSVVGARLASAWAISGFVERCEQRAG